MNGFRIYAGVLLATVALAGCGEKKDVDVKNASPGDVAAKVAGSDMHFTPGEWETQIKTADFEVEGMPPEVAAQMKQAMAQGKDAQIVRTCLTPEKAANPGKDFFASRDKDCQFKDFTMGDGKINGTLQCQGGASRGSSMTMSGTYNPDSYTMDINSTGMQGDKKMKVHIVATSHHVGDCKPGDEKG